jgi:DNA-binding NtrC family response regulator
MPALREREKDILLLLEYFIRRYAGKMGKNIHSIDERTLEFFQAYDWPGNIRELQNIVERSVILSSDGVFSVDESWFSKGLSQPASRSLSRPVEDEKSQERKVIEAALAESRGRIAGPGGAAARLRIPRSTLESKIRALEIRKNQFKFAGAGL